MIQKYLYGVPFDTESVVAPIPASQGDPPVGTVKTSESGFCFACPLAEGDRVSKIGQLIGNKDHATVLHACKIVKDQVEVDKSFKADIEEIEALLRRK